MSRIRLVLILVSLIHAASPYADAAAAIVSKTIDFLYIESNVGGSSGGHVALKLDDTVYHFEHYSDDLFRIARDDWRHFRYVYNGLENRPLYIAKVPVSTAVYDRIQNRLVRLYLVQNKHLNVLDGLETDQTIVEALLWPGKEIPLRGAGLFAEAGTDDRNAIVLREAIRQTFGQAFLPREILRLESTLQTHTVTVQNLTALHLSRDRFLTGVQSFSQRYLETRLRLEALTILKDARPLHHGALLDPARFDAEGDRGQLTPRERQQLHRYAQHLAASVLQLVESHRPDGGYPLILAIARYQAVQRSLQANRLLVLDPFSVDAIVIPQATISKKHAITGLLARQAEGLYQKARNQAFANQGLDEIGYNRIENAAGRYYEIQRGHVLGSAVRVERDHLIPSRSRMFVPIRIDEKRVDLPAILTSIKASQTDYSRKLTTLYQYELIGSNCVTELVWSVNSAFDRKKDIVDSLGGYLSPGEALTFIPFRFFDEIANRFAVSTIEVWPSYRQRKLAQLYEHEESIQVYLREANTLTSTVYKGMRADGAFLLFTDDVFWARPLYGALNLGYGLASAGVGIFTLPADGGARVSRGLRGAFFSLPELFFFNIRKGSFEYVEPEASDAVSDGSGLLESAFM